MAAARKVYRSEVDLYFLYKEHKSSKVVSYQIMPERISYVMIEHMYENEHILPVIYVSLNIETEMFSKVVDSNEYSQFRLKIRKKNILAKHPILETIVDDKFNYVSSNSNANPANSLATSGDDNYIGITLGLVSDAMTNKLRQSFNGVYKYITDGTFIDKEILKGFPNLIREKYTYTHYYDKILIPPITSVYKFINFLFNKAPFYDSLFTFYMDFSRTYLISKSGKAVDAKDGKPNKVNLYVKEYTADEAYIDGFTIENGTYMVYANSNDSKVTVNNATEKAINNIIAFKSDKKQNLNMGINNSENISTKTNYVKTRNAGVLKNEIQSNAVMLQVTKKHIDTEIFTPNKSYLVSNYGDYAKYDGNYFLSYKKELYTFTTNGEFLMSATIGLKRCVLQEIATTSADTYSVEQVKASGKKKKMKSSAKKETLKSKPANRK